MLESFKVSCWREYLGSPDGILKHEAEEERRGEARKDTGLEFSIYVT
jgi:hypothetical protein